jgi:pimeloyl-ACP methyl ester carboxylesterase
MDAAFLLLIPAVVLLLLLLALGRLFVRQDSLIFRPSRQLGRRTPADYALPYEDLHLVGRDGNRVSAWWIPSPHSHQAVVFFHGSDGNLAHEFRTARFLNSLGVSALLVEYPGYGADRSRPSEDGCYRAAEAAWDLVVDHKSFAPDQVILFGFSLGTAVATHLAAQRTCAGLVLHSGFTSVPDLAARIYPWLPVRPFCRTKMDSLRRIQRCRAPLLMIHSRDDEHIPIDNARRLYQRAPGRKRFVTLCGSHFGSSWPNQPEVIEAWRQLLTRQTASWEVGHAGDPDA